MLRYIGGKSEEADKLVCIISISFMSINNSTKWFTDSSLDIDFFERRRKKYNHERLLDMEIVALQSELAKFILAEVLKKDGVFSIAQSMKYKDQYGPERLARSPRSIAQSVKFENISFLFWGIEIWIRTFEL